jgi:diguanylate cyclase (GGDEF)-like protein
MENDQSIKILLIDDDEEEFIITKEIISEIKNQRYSVEWVSTYEKALTEMQKDIYDVFLVDYNLGIKTGLDLIDEGLNIDGNTPLIMLTGLDDRDIDLLAMKKGVSDFLRKGKIDAESLERSIRYAIEKKKTENQILYLAYYDQVTNLPNRIFFKEQLNYTLAHAIRYKRMMAIMYLDLDNFKLINDSLGHQVGDLFLKEIGRRLCESIRKSDIIARNDLKTFIDTVARMGGDEFTISLTEIADYESASIVAERIIKNLNVKLTIEGHEVFTSASIGISLYPLDSNDADTLLKYADNAMYYAKKQGKNCFQYYQKNMNDNVSDKMRMILNIRKAAERNEFMLHYQPKMNIKTGNLIGFESLIRWNSAEGGLIPPMDFIPFAESNNLIGFITDWVIREVCKQLHEWETAKLAILPVSINLPIIQFRKPDFMRDLKKITDSYGISTKFLELEVTESIFMEDMNATNAKLAELRALGFQISIDDFGTGFSSLNRLKEIPCNTLKIDKSFIKSVSENSPDSIIVNSIIAMGHGLNMAILAEGVETIEQLDFLYHNNCDFIQGYLLSRPLPSEHIPGILIKEAQGEGIGLQLIKKMKDSVEGTQ